MDGRVRGWGSGWWGEGMRKVDGGSKWGEEWMGEVNGVRSGWGRGRYNKYKQRIESMYYEQHI